MRQGKIATVDHYDFGRDFRPWRIKVDRERQWMFATTREGMEAEGEHEEGESSRGAKRRWRESRAQRESSRADLGSEAPQARAATQARGRRRKTEHQSLAERSDQGSHAKNFSRETRITEDMENALGKSPKSREILDSMQRRCALRHGPVEGGKDAGSKGDPMPEGGQSKPSHDVQQILAGSANEHSSRQTSNLDPSGVHDEVGVAAMNTTTRPHENRRRCAQDCPRR